MNYENYDNGCVRNGQACDPMPVASMTDLMKETSIMAADALKLSRRINAHLFGVGNPLCENEADPKCFRDELDKTHCELMATIEELHKICSMLGV